MSDRYYNYETKCRRCGNLQQWNGLPAERFEYKSFQEMMYSQVQEPRQYRCDKCDRYTVQDVCAYDLPEPQ
jgi:rRNA maturation protein Nop10